MSKINFKSKLIKIGSQAIIKLPKEASSKLPSRGLAMVDGKINGFNFQTPLEPDGKGSHWFKVDETMSKATKTKIGDNVSITVEPVKKWPEPKIPSDLKNALKKDLEANKLWKNITPLSRWDWIRWINATKNPETRKIRIEKTFSKLKTGKRNACCFNRSECTDPSVSHRGMLLEPKI